MSAPNPPQGFPVVNLSAEPSNRVTFLNNYLANVPNTLLTAHVEGFERRRGPGVLPTQQSNGATPPSYTAASTVTRVASAQPMEPPSSVTIARS